MEKGGDRKAKVCHRGGRRGGLAVRPMGRAVFGSAALPVALDWARLGDAPEEVRAGCPALVSRAAEEAGEAGAGGRPRAPRVPLLSHGLGAPAGHIGLARGPLPPLGLG